MAPTLVEKAEKAEAEALATLELRSNQAKASLQGEQRSLLNERVAKALLQNLEEAVVLYEQSITTIFAAAGNDDAKKQSFLEKLSDQMAITNPILDELHTIVETIKAANNPPTAVVDQSSKLLMTIQLKIKLVQKTIESHLHIIQDAKKQEDMQTSLNKIQVNLNQLDKI